MSIDVVDINSYGFHDNPLDDVLRLFFKKPSAMFFKNDKSRHHPVEFFRNLREMDDIIIFHPDGRVP